MFYCVSLPLICLILTDVAANQNDEAFGSITEDGCFVDYPSSKVQCAKPFEVCPNVNSAEECRKICCQRPTCTGVQYQISTKQCSLYDSTIVINYGFTMPPRIKRQAYIQCGDGPPTLIRNMPDFCFSQKTDNPACSFVTGIPALFSTETPPPPLPPLVTEAPSSPTATEPLPPPPSPPPEMTSPPPEMTSLPLPPPPSPPPPSPPSLDTTTAPPMIITTVLLTESTTPAIVPSEACPKGKSLLMYQYRGYKLKASSSGDGFSAADENGCVQACINNKLPSGKVVSCQSADFNKETNNCQIYSSASPPIGSDQISTDASTNHYEKSCVDSNTVKTCQQGIITMQPQKILVGYAETVVTALNRQDCILQCLDSMKHFEFKCASGMFYSNEPANNCILNSESATSQPTLVFDETDPEVYFEPLCQPIGKLLKSHQRRKRQANLPKPKRRRNVIWPNIPNWGSWTRCDSVDRKRRHYRNCKSFNPNKCEVASESCDPKNRAKELKDIANEEKAPFLSTVAPLKEESVKANKNPSEKAHGQEKGKGKGPKR